MKHKRIDKLNRSLRIYETALKDLKKFDREDREYIKKQIKMLSKKRNPMAQT